MLTAALVITTAPLTDKHKHPTLPLKVVPPHVPLYSLIITDAFVVMQLQSSLLIEHVAHQFELNADHLKQDPPQLDQP